MAKIPKLTPYMIQHTPDQVSFTLNKVIDEVNEGQSSKGKTEEIDTVMSDISSNPVQNKVIKNYIDEREGFGATIRIGQTKTGAPGTAADVVNEGTNKNLVLDFTIPQGRDGARGEKGDTGPQGATGAQGPKGEKGDEGLQGVRGPKGEQGPRGEQGPMGPEGPFGPQGIQGIQGRPGERGEQGPQGETGAQGLPGEDGKDTVYVGTTPPTDPDMKVWINPDGQPSEAIATEQYVQDEIAKIPLGGPVDESMSDTSKNAVQNKVIKGYVDNLAGQVGPLLADKSLGITGATTGQIIEVETIDASGKPTKWRAVEKGGGGQSVTTYINPTSIPFKNGMQIVAYTNGKAVINFKIGNASAPHNVQTGNDVIWFLNLQTSEKSGSFIYPSGTRLYMPYGVNDPTEIVVAKSPASVKVVINVIGG